jgi:hypothetical protein
MQGLATSGFLLVVAQSGWLALPGDYHSLTRDETRNLNASFEIPT